MKYNPTEAAAAVATDTTVGSRNQHQPKPRPETCRHCNKEFSSKKALHGHMRMHGVMKNSGLGSGSGSGSGSSADSGVTVLEGWKVKGKRTKRECVSQGSASAFSGYSEFNDDEMIVAEALLTLVVGCWGDRTERRATNNNNNSSVGKKEEVCEKNNDYFAKMKGLMLSEDDDDDDDEDDDDDDDLILPKYYLGSPLSSDYCYGSCSYSVSDNSHSLPYSSSNNNCGVNNSSPSTSYLTFDLNCSPPTPCSTLDYPNSSPSTQPDDTAAEKAVMIKRKKGDNRSSRNKKRLILSNSTTPASVVVVHDLTERIELVNVADDSKEMTTEVMAAAQLEKRRWECDICNKTFPTHQALGGHKSSHRSKKVAKDGENNNNNNSPEKVAFSKYRCKICDQSFASGQALGGHQRLHYVPSSSSSSPESPPQQQVINSRIGHTHADMVDDLIDLTLRL